MTNEKIESMLRWRDQLKATPAEHNLRRTVLAIVEAVEEADADLNKVRMDSLASRLDGGYADSDLDVDNDCEDKVDSPPNCDHDKSTPHRQGPFAPRKSDPEATAS